jgi:hypothetical protein
MMANLSSLEGISDARNDLYSKLEAGTIDDKRAAQMERVLRGQVELKAHVPIRLLNVVKAVKGTRAEGHMHTLVRTLLKFTTGEDVPALEEGKPV